VEVVEGLIIGGLNLEETKSAKGMTSHDYARVIGSEMKTEAESRWIMKGGKDSIRTCILFPIQLILYNKL